LTKRDNIFIVIKRDDALEYLDEAERLQLEHVLSQIAKGRKKDGKISDHRYWVVNRDEPYADSIGELIEFYESAKTCP